MLALFILLIFIVLFYFGYALVEVILIIYITSEMLDYFKVHYIVGLTLSLKMCFCSNTFSIFIRIYM